MAEKLLNDIPRATLTSLNTIKHGCRSKQLLLPHEDPNEWIKMREMYMEEFQPQTAFLEELLEEAVKAHWIYKRTQHRLYLVQFDLPEDPRLWRPEDHHQIALFTRYQTAAERTYHRALARLRSYHKDQVRKDQIVKEEGKKEDMKAARAPKQAHEEPVVMEQWVEIRRIDNKVVTQFFPPNDELEQMINEAEPRPTLVYRRLFFPDGVPAQYQWTRPRKGQATNGGLAMQRMTVETWRSLRAKERESGLAESTGQVTLRDWRDGEAADI
ncbi:MAG TPA: hypothetical protein VHZ07_06665 [Bryobacteraceae bacterium]|jgi:hypothetical protein|nr:hypothetical protein [Bryobacteraceae bacterium]